MDKTTSDDIQKYSKYFRDMRAIEEIEHILDEMFVMYV